MKSYITLLVVFLAAVPAALATSNISLSGLRSDTYVQINDGDTNPNQDVTQFGPVTPGGTSTRTFSVNNTGDETLTISSYSSSNSQFTISGGASSIEPDAGFKDFTITFRPTSAGVHTTTITIRSNVPGTKDPYTFALTGNGSEPDIEVEGSASGSWVDIVDGDLNPDQAVTRIGDVPIGESRFRNFRVRNTGDGTLNISSATSSNSRFDIRGVSTSILPGFSDSFSIYYTSDRLGTYNSTITIRSDDPDSGVYTFAVTATGTAPNIVVEGAEAGGWENIVAGDRDPDQVVTQFGEVPLGTTGTRTFRVRNNGTARLSISSVASSDPQFSLLGVDPDLQSGDAEEFTIDFTPTAVGAQTADITFRSNDPSGKDPFTFTVHGIGTDAVAETDRRITAISVVGSSVNLSFETAPDALYKITTSTDLNTWSDVAGQTGISGTGGIVSRTLAGLGVPPALGGRFFRVEGE